MTINYNFPNQSGCLLHSACQAAADTLQTPQALPEELLAERAAWLAVFPVERLLRSAFYAVAQLHGAGRLAATGRHTFLWAQFVDRTDAAYTHLPSCLAACSPSLHHSTDSAQTAAAATGYSRCAGKQVERQQNAVHVKGTSLLCMMSSAHGVRQ